MLHSMTIRLIHVHQLETLYLCYGVKGQPGVIWGHRGQKVIFTKNATSTDYMAWLCNSCIYIHKLETLYSIHGVKVNFGSLPPANIMRLCPDLFPDLVSSSSSSSSSSVNTSKSYISDMTWPILTRLGHKYRLTIPFMSHDQIRVKGHVGVTGVKKVIFTKNATSPTDYRVWSCDSCTCISLTPSTKVMGLKIHPGSFGVTGVKKVIFTKNATSPTNYRVWSCDSCTYISLTPSTKVMGLKIHPGSFGVTGVKRSFSLKTLLLLQLTGYGHVTHVHASAWPPLQKLWV